MDDEGIVQENTKSNDKATLAETPSSVVRVLFKVVTSR